MKFTDRTEITVGSVRYLPKPIGTLEMSSYEFLLGLILYQPPVLFVLLLLVGFCYHQFGPIQPCRYLELLLPILLLVAIITKPKRPTLRRRSVHLKHPPDLLLCQVLSFFVILNLTYNHIPYINFHLDRN